MTQKRDRKTGQYTFSKEEPPTAKRVIPVAKSSTPKKPKTITVNARHGRLEIPTNKITDETRWVFRNGQCFALAIVLAEKNGTDVGLLVEGSDLPWGTRYYDPALILDLDHDWFKDTIHAIALTEDSTEDETMTLDIDGDRDMGAIREEFIDLHSGTMIRIKPNELRRILIKYRTGTGFYQPDYESAALIAPLIKFS